MKIATVTFDIKYPDETVTTEEIRKEVENHLRSFNIEGATSVEGVAEISMHDITIIMGR